LNFLKAHKMNFVIAMTKADKLKKMQKLKRLEELEEELADYGDYKKIPCSALTGEGIEELQELIAQSVK
ncbi:MAG TPA: YihA family ribosome biogenesis GTP-binding protein, partial [Oscillospiraceae bacterium]|nr:YihA family ribosome biogenesis GTP-binding protein [Oscillospiraceae bacterium]